MDGGYGGDRDCSGGGAGARGAAIGRFGRAGGTADSGVGRYGTVGGIVGVGLTGQMHGLVLLDARGEVLRPCILWNDQRTAAQCAAIAERVGARRVIELTGNPVLTGFTAPKLLWVREHEPEVYRRIAHVLLPKDYIRYRLTGELLGDVSDASGTSLFDVGRRCWSDEMLAALDVPRSWLAEVTESPVASAKVNERGARESGLAGGNAGCRRGGRSGSASGRDGDHR